MSIDGTVLYYTSRYHDGPCYCFRHAVIRSLIKSEEMYPWVEEPLGQDEYDMRSDPQCADCKMEEKDAETARLVRDIDEGKLRIRVGTKSLLEELEELARELETPSVVDLRREKVDEHMEQKS